MEGGGGLRLTNMANWMYDGGRAFSSLPIWESHTFRYLAFLFHIVYKKNASAQTESILAHLHCECPDRKYPCTSTFWTYFRPTKRLVVTVIVDSVSTTVHDNGYIPLPPKCQSCDNSVASLFSSLSLPYAASVHILPLR